MIFMNTKPRTEVLRLCDRALELDPKFAGALWLRALVEELVWDRPASLRAVMSQWTVQRVAAAE